MSLYNIKCATLSESRAIVGFVGLVLSCRCIFAGISWVQIFFSWYFVAPKFCLVGISWVQNFVWLVFCGSKIFSRGYFVGLIFFSWLTSWFKDFLISTIFRFLVVSSVYIRKVLLYFVFSFVLTAFLTVIDSYWKINYPIVSLIIQNILVANYSCSPPGRNSSSFFDFGPRWRSKTLSFGGSEHSPIFQFLDVTLCCRLSFVKYKK